MLAVVSAVVAFDRWPGANVEAPAQTLVLDEKAPPIRVSANSTATSATRATRVSAARGATARRVPNGAGGAGERIAGGSPGAGAPATAAPAVPPVLPRAPSIPTPDSILDPIPNPGNAASQIADGAQSVTDSA